MATIAPHKEVATSTLAGGLVECFKMAGTEAFLADRVRAHDSRSVSSSWALFNGTSLKEIQQAAFLVVSQLLCKIVISRMLWLVRLLSRSWFWSPLFRDLLVQGQPGGFPRLRVIFWGCFYPSSLFLYFLCQSSTLKVKKVGYYPTIDYDYQNW